MDIDKRIRRVAIAGLLASFSSLMDIDKRIRAKGSNLRLRCFSSLMDIDKRIRKRYLFMLVMVLVH